MYPVPPARVVVLAPPEASEEHLLHILVGRGLFLAL